MKMIMIMKVEMEVDVQIEEDIVPLDEVFEIEAASILDRVVSRSRIFQDWCDANTENHVEFNDEEED